MVSCALGIGTSSSIVRGPRYDSGDGMGVKQSAIGTLLQTTDKSLSSWIPQNELFIHRLVPRVATS